MIDRGKIDARLVARFPTLASHVGITIYRKIAEAVLDEIAEQKMLHSADWLAMSREPATDDEIASYKRHEGCIGPESCLGCMEKFRLIARMEAAEAALRNAPDGTHCRSCCYLQAPCDEHKGTAK